MNYSATKRSIHRSGKPETRTSGIGGQRNFVARRDWGNSFGAATQVAARLAGPGVRAVRRTKTIKVDVRLIAATNRDLVRAVQDKEFRGDLFYRLHVFPLHLPALRDRREDIPMLVRHFVEKCAARLHKRIEIIPDEAVEAMVYWRWPGNIRELENFIERSVILSEGNRLSAPLGELREEVLRQPSESEGTLRDKERDHIVGILRQTRGALSGPSGAAARLGLKRTTLQYKMQRLGISRTDYLN